MKFSSILKKVNFEFDKDLKLVKKFTDGFRNSVFLVKDTKSGGRHVLIVYKKEGGIEETIENAHKVAIYLADFGFPTRVPLTTKKEEEIINFENRFLCLYNYLDGISIPWEAYNRRHLKAIGKILSDMHFHLEKYKPQVNFPELKDLLKTEIDFMNKYFLEVEPWIIKKLGVKLNWEKLKKIFHFVEEFKQDNDILHLDFVRGNIIFGEEILQDSTIEIKGILDFEKTAKGSFVSDIARTLSFLIVDCKYKSEREIVKWFMDRGYIKRGKNKILFSKEELYNFIYYFWIKDFWKFLAHNPYEYLSQNEHYIRTRDKLVENDLLQFAS